LVQLEETRGDFVVRQVRGPATGGGDRSLQLPDGCCEPGRALVVEAGQRSLLQLLRALLVLRQKAVWIARHDFRHANDEIANGLVMGERRGRVKPAESAAFVAMIEELPIVADRATGDRALHET
jgi:hypothetical protein